MNELFILLISYYQNNVSRKRFPVTIIITCGKFQTGNFQTVCAFSLLFDMSPWHSYARENALSHAIVRFGFLYITQRNFDKKAQILTWKSQTFDKTVKFVQFRNFKADVWTHNKIFEIVNILSWPNVSTTKLKVLLVKTTDPIGISLRINFGMLLTSLLACCFSVCTFINISKT